MQLATFRSPSSVFGARIVPPSLRRRIPRERLDAVALGILLLVLLVATAMKMLLPHKVALLVLVGSAATGIAAVGIASVRQAKCTGMRCRESTKAPLQQSPTTSVPSIPAQTATGHAAKQPKPQRYLARIGPEVSKGVPNGAGATRALDDAAANARKTKEEFSAARTKANEDTAESANPLRQLRIGGFATAVEINSTAESAPMLAPRNSLPLKTSDPAPTSGCSESSQESLEDLQLQVQNLKQEQNLKQNLDISDGSVRSARSSARSETSQSIIDELQWKIQKLQAEKGSGSTQHPSTVGRTTSREQLACLLRSLELPLEYDKLLFDDGIEFVKDLEGYNEAELVEIGFKRAHVKRLLKAVGAQTVASPTCDASR